MKIYTGISYHTLDDKNRLFIPPKYRGKSKTYILVSGIDECITIYSLDHWPKIVKKVESLSLKNKTHQRIFIRTFFADAEFVEMDNQGRVLIPQKFKDKYKLISKVVLVGVKDKLELWSEKSWAQHYSVSSTLLKKIKSQLEI